MATFLEAAKAAIRSTYCALLSGNDWLNGGIGRLAPPLREFSRSITAAQRRLAGCDPANDVPPPAPPFDGGQCLCSIYSVRIETTYTREGSNPPESITGFLLRRVRGPVVGGSVGLTAANRPTFTFSANSVSDNNTTTPPCRPEGTVQTREFATSQAAAEPGSLSAPIITVTLVSGPDDCGSPPIIYPPPIVRPIDIDVTFQPDFGPEITVPITVNYSPFEVNLNGDINFPFNFDFGGFEYSGSIDIAPEINVRINPPRLPRGTGSGTETLPPDGPGETIPPAPPEQKIIGVVVTSEIVNQGKVSDYSSPGIPPIYVPRLGSVKFVYSFGGATFWSSDIDIKDRRTFIECPFSQGADAVIASPQLGVNMTAVPIRGYALATTNDIAPN